MIHRRIVHLNEAEHQELFRDDGANQTGGFQNLIRKLREQCIGRSHVQGVPVVICDLDAGDQERIPRYAFDYKGGGWENRLKAIFGRVLGPYLGRGELAKPEAAGLFEGDE
jgi:hypothetical protein